MFRAPVAVASRDREPGGRRSRSRTGAPGRERSERLAALWPSCDSRRCLGGADWRADGLSVAMLETHGVDLVFWREDRTRVTLRPRSRRPQRIPPPQLIAGRRPARVRSHRAALEGAEQTWWDERRGPMRRRRPDQRRAPAFPGSSECQLVATAMERRLRMRLRHQTRNGRQQRASLPHARAAHGAHLSLPIQTPGASSPPVTNSKAFQSPCVSTCLGEASRGEAEAGGGIPTPSTAGQARAARAPR